MDGIEKGRPCVALQDLQACFPGQPPLWNCNYSVHSGSFSEDRACAEHKNVCKYDLNDPKLDPVSGPLPPSLK